MLLNYEFFGEPDNPVILFLHGFMGNTREFARVVSLLSGDFYCLTVDLPGHGKTGISGDEDLQMENVANAVIQLLDRFLQHFDNGKCILIGYSMGGRLGLYLTLHYSKYFSHIILESASPGLKTASQREERIKRDGQIARKLNRIKNQAEFKVFLNNWYQQPVFGDIKNHPLFSEVIDIRVNNNPAFLAKSLEIMGTGSQPSLWSKLTENKVPILLMVGEQDRKFVEINQQMHESLKKSKLKVIKDTAHNIHFQNPSGFVDSAIAFLDDDLEFGRNK